MILYTLYKNSYIDIAHLESTKGITLKTSVISTKSKTPEKKNMP